MTYYLMRLHYPGPRNSPDLCLGRRVCRIALRQVVDWLRECPSQWCKGELALDQFGEEVAGNSPSSRQWSALGRLEFLSSAGRFHASMSAGAGAVIAITNSAAEDSHQMAQGLEDLI